MISWIVSSALLIVLIIAVRYLFRGRISPKLQYALWLLVLLRLLLPVSIGRSAASVMNYLPETGSLSQPQAPPVTRPEAQPAAPVDRPAPAPAPNLPVPAEPVTDPVPEAEPKATLPAEKSFDYKSLLLPLWLAGIGLVLLCLLWANLRFWLRLRRSRIPAGNYRGLPVYECQWLETPCMFGLLHPAIYLSGGLEGERRAHALRHEHGHFSQGDHIWAMLRGFCLAVHWYDPLVWLAARLSRRDGELACDQRVTGRLTDAQRIEYGHTLISLSCNGREPVFCAATTMSFKGKTLRERVEYIARRPKMLLSTMMIALLAAALAVGCTFTGAKPEAPVETEEPRESAAAVTATTQLSELDPAYSQQRRTDQMQRALSLPDIDPGSYELTLVNNDKLLDKDYGPEPLAEISSENYMMFNAEFLPYAESFLEAAREAGFRVSVSSAYRDYSYQTYLFNSEAARIAKELAGGKAVSASDPLYQEAVKKAAENAAVPGSSEHQLGLAIDIRNDWYKLHVEYNEVSKQFYDWLDEHCAEYGFIKRYPSEKKSITGFDEPWHYRYVGLEAAEYIMANELCLEEFLAMYDYSEPTVQPIYRGKLLDRNGQPLDMGRYPTLADAEDAFGAYLSEGNNVSLTIDAGLQQKAQEILEQYLGDTGGAVVLLDVNNGEPLAIAGNGGISPLTSSFQPGTLMLPCTGIAALDESILKAEDEIKCEGVFDRYADDGYTAECWIWNAVPGEHHCHSEENLSEALRDDCQYYFYSVGNAVGIDILAEYTKELGLGQPTGIELWESPGHMANRAAAMDRGHDWRIGDTLDAVVGRGSSRFTPLQYAVYCAAIANNGQRYSASMLKEVSSESGESLYIRQPVMLGNVLNTREQELSELLESWRILLDSNWNAIHQGLHDKVNDPAMNNSSIWQNAVDIAGSMTVNEFGECLFMGYAPYDDPKYAICVVQSEGDNERLSQEIARDLLNQCDYN